MAVETDREWFGGRLLHHLGDSVKLSPGQINLLYNHFRLLLLWNSRLNLSAIRSPDEIVDRHYGESLFFAAQIPDFGKSVADVGSGAGFPGIPVAILHPEWNVTLIESHQRKAVFLRESSRNMHNVTVIDQRAEDVDQYFDCVVSRAVRPGDIVRLLPGLARGIGLLLSRSDFSEIETGSSINWLSPHAIPWSNNNLCVFGVFHVER